MRLKKKFIILLLKITTRERRLPTEKLDEIPGKHLRGMRFIKIYILFYQSPQGRVDFLRKKWISALEKHLKGMRFIKKNIQITTKER